MMAGISTNSSIFPRLVARYYQARERYFVDSVVDPECGLLDGSYRYVLLFNSDRGYIHRDNKDASI